MSPIGITVSPTVEGHDRIQHALSK